MARKANTNLFLEFTWDQAHVHDIVKGRDALWLVQQYTRQGIRVHVVLRNLDTHAEQAWTLDTTRIVSLRMEHKCHCQGTGVHYGRGYVENGTFRGTTGTCYACGGKGYQSRSDIIRNYTYWAKYARV